MLVTDHRPLTRASVLARNPATTSDRPANPVAPRFDPDVPHPARIYAHWLGSKDHYPADRKAAEEVAAHRPQVVAGARANRAFAARAVRYLAGQRAIAQFLDIGPGLPVPGNTHEVAQAITPESKIVYADNDRCVPSCAHAHGRRSRPSMQLRQSLISHGLKIFCLHLTGVEHDCLDRLRSRVASTTGISRAWNETQANAAGPSRRHGRQEDARGVAVHDHPKPIPCVRFAYHAYPVRLDRSNAYS